MVLSKSNQLASALPLAVLALARSRRSSESKESSPKPVASVVRSASVAPPKPAPKRPYNVLLIMIITADHGEGFGERGRFRHAYDVWESLVRVPLFIYVPGAKARRIEVSRSAIDLAPSIADLMGLPNDPPFRGKSLLGEVFGDETKPRPIVVALPRSDTMDRRRAVIDGD